MAKKQQGTAAEALSPLLYGRVPLDQWPPDDSSTEEPWRSFVEARQAVQSGRTAEAEAAWQRIAAMEGIEARHAIQAWTFLRANGVQPDDGIATRVLGVVVEVPVDDGRDVLAAYADGSARYLNHTGKASVVEAGTPSTEPLVHALVAAAQPLADVIGLWGEQALPDLPPADTRLLVLTPGGPRFGQGPLDALMQEPRAQALFAAATELLTAVVDLST